MYICLTQRACSILLQSDCKITSATKKTEFLLCLRRVGVREVRSLVIIITYKQPYVEEHSNESKGVETIREDNSNLV